MEKGLTIKYSSKIEKLPPYPFAVIDEMKSKALQEGVDLIDLSIGDPDLPTPQPIVDAMKEAVDNPANHHYPSYAGMLTFREAVAAWYKRRFNVTLNPGAEVQSLIGSKEGIAHIPLAFINSGDIVLGTSPGYPVYQVSAILAGGEAYPLPLLEENHYFPDLKAIPEDILRRSRLLFINYPNNPTSVLATAEFFNEVVEFAHKHNIIVCHDAAYTELYFDNQKPLSFLQIDGAKEVGVEFHSLSKTYNMTGWRIGFVCGHAKVLQGLGRVKTNVDSGVFQAVQEAGIKALSLDESMLQSIRHTFEERRDVFYQGLTELGLKANKPLATFYLWATVPDRQRSVDFVGRLLKDAGILTTPGNGFGQHGEGYVRFTFTQPVERLKEALDRLKRVL